MKLDIVVKVILIVYFFIFISTESLSFFHILTRQNILIVDVFFFFLLLKSFKKEFLGLLKNINFKSLTTKFILVLLILTLIQGISSAPSTTDAMNYHIPRVMHWLNNSTTIQISVRNFHDFMPPFPEYILLHLYSITDSDRLLFFSQWIAFVTSVFLCGEIFILLKGDKKLKQSVILMSALTPIAIMESVSTQVDLQSNVFILLAVYVGLILINTKKTRYALILGVIFGLGMLTKQTFAAFAIIPCSLLLYLIRIDWRKGVIAVVIIAVLAFVMQLSFFNQNIRLYGNFSGQQLIGRGNIFFNEIISPQAAFSTMLKNAFINIPVPVGKEIAENFLINLSSFIGIDINDARIMVNPSLKFHLLSIIYPQEDMVSNPIQLILILITGFLLILYWKKIPNVLIKYLFIFLIVSFIFFSLILKWNLYNIRLEIPIFMIGMVLSYLILSISKVGKKILSISLIVSLPLGIVIILLNVSRPYISYNTFYDTVRSYAPPNSVLPEAFYTRSRTRQYFNARPYWFDPYDKVTNLILQQKDSPQIKLDIMDEFEYPLWVLLKEKGVKFVINDNIETNSKDLILSTSELPYFKERYNTICFKTDIEYGYACLSKKNN